MDASLPQITPVTIATKQARLDLLQSEG